MKLNHQSFSLFIQRRNLLSPALNISLNRPNCLKCTTKILPASVQLLNTNASHSCRNARLWLGPTKQQLAVSDVDQRPRRQSPQLPLTLPLHEEPLLAAATRCEATRHTSILSHQLAAWVAPVGCRSSVLVLLIVACAFRDDCAAAGLCVVC